MDWCDENGLYLHHIGWEWISNWSMFGLAFILIQKKNTKLATHKFFVKYSSELRTCFVKIFLLVRARTLHFLDERREALRFLNALMTTYGTRNS